MSSLFCRFHGKTSSSKPPTEPQLPPRHSHRRMVAHYRKRPMVIYYSPKVADFDEVITDASPITDASLITDDELSENESSRSKRSVHVNADPKAPDFPASVGPKDHLARSRGPLTRVSQTFRRVSERLDPARKDGRRGRGRAARQNATYDVAWRQDDESACCRVCFAMFTKLARRRHHCRVCGELVCGACSQDQVSVTTKFPAPRRACVACCTLLQAMARAGDDRVEIVSRSDVPGASRTRRQRQSAFVGSTCHSPAMPAPAATPRYRDRLTEVHRVMAAGKLSRRRGSAENKMYVISSRWLRNWLAFTSAASSANSNCDLDYGYDTEVSSPAPRNDNSASMGRAPGPIDNLSLLELSRGKLVRRPGLIRDDVISGDAASVGEDADFQLLSPEVWEVFQRLYGGAPAIYVNLASADPMAWVIDVSDLLTAGINASGNKVLVLPVVDRALTSRHKSETDCGDARAGSNQAGSSTEFRSMGSRYTTTLDSRQQPPKSAAWTVTSSSSSSSLSKEKERGRSPLERGQMQPEDLESDVAALFIGVSKMPTESDDDMRTTTSIRSPAAAYAASAFAVAMKQARLNAQKAIDDRASRVITA